VDAVKVNPQYGAAIGMVTRMGALFPLDARRHVLSAEVRRRVYWRSTCRAL
jgi:hypothetical protein